MPNILSPNEQTNVASARARLASSTGLLLGMAGLAGLAFVGGLVALSPWASPRLPLEVSAEQLDLGQVWARKDFEWTIAVRNTTSSPIEVVDVLPSCSCTAAEPTSFVVPPSGHAEVRLTIDLTSDSAQSGDVEHFAEQFAVVLRDMLPRQQSWTLRGRVRPALVLSPPELRLGDFFAGAEDVASEVAIHPAGPVERIVASCDPDLADVTVRKTDAAPAFVLRVCPSSELTGDFSFAVALKALDPQGREIASTDYRVIGSALARFHALPRAIDLGLLAPRERGRASVVLQSRTGDEFSIIDVRPGAGVEVHPGTTGAATEHTVHVVASYATEGVHATAIELEASDRSGTRDTVSVPIQAHVSLPLHVDNARVRAEGSP